MLRVQLLDYMNWAAGEGGIVKKECNMVRYMLEKGILAAYEGWIGEKD